MKFKNTLFLPLFIIVLSCKQSSENNLLKAHLDTEQRQQASSHSYKQMTLVLPGANQTQTYLPLVKGKKIALAANPTSVIFHKGVGQQALSFDSEAADTKYFKTKDYTHLADSLIHLGMQLIKVFSPEHGFRGRADAGETVKDGVDIHTKLPVISLYGRNKKPTPEDLKDVEIIIFDMQDVGVRFYTYISTLHYVMEACAENNIPLIVLDRPNPNGYYVDGPILEKKSFLGLHPVPLVYGMTIGEYARMINGEKWLAGEVHCDLTVVTCENYDRSLRYHLPVKPSPNLPNDKAINLYPSLGLFEGTHINAGRGTDYQFQLIGAPFFDPKQYSYTYTPVSKEGAKNPKHKDSLCFGLDLRTYPVLKEITLTWILEAYQNTPEGYDFFKDPSFSLHAGNELLKQQIIAGMNEKAIKESWQPGILTFLDIRQKYLLYP
ncbi:DUF1343 domain-containing protein [Ascidiimonas aurantiaca]|uniref:exo-beta-N-acetylmuramidase NamZ family protein n=1 Tax=Ascidiimonas aurantiaca TaxID=1685432 RepID=UPI0030EBF9DE